MVRCLIVWSRNRSGEVKGGERQEGVGRGWLGVSLYGLEIELERSKRWLGVSLYDPEIELKKSRW